MGPCHQPASHEQELHNYQAWLVSELLDPIQWARAETAAFPQMYDGLAVGEFFIYSTLLLALSMHNAGHKTQLRHDASRHKACKFRCHHHQSVCIARLFVV